MFIVPSALVWLLCTAILTTFSTWALGWPSPWPSLGLDAWWGTFVFLAGFSAAIAFIGLALMGVLLVGMERDGQDGYLPRR